MGLFRLNEADNVRGVTPGVSTSPFMKKKSAMGYNNSPDIGNIIPDAEYDAAYDKTFFADGDKAETSKINIPAILAAKTAGGAPHGCTVHNGISNKFGSDVFKLKKLRDDCYDCNC